MSIQPRHYTMAIDQHGQHYDDLGAHPRTGLALRLGYSPKSARKMYAEAADGSMEHIGYVVGPYYCTLYFVQRWTSPQGETP